MVGWASGEGDVKGVGIVEDVFSVGANLRPKLIPVNDELALYINLFNTLKNKASPLVPQGRLELPRHFWH